MQSNYIFSKGASQNESKGYWGFFTAFLERRLLRNYIYFDGE